MIKNYNLALVPLHSQSKIIELSVKLKSLAYTYFLSESSLPHLTLYCFEYEENDVENLWKKISECWKHNNIFLELSKISYITFDEKVFWASLIPTKSSVLQEMHAIIAEVLKLPIKPHYDPHVTLINTLDLGYEAIIHDKIISSLPVNDEFALALGNCDEHGQFTKVLYMHH